MPDPGRNRKPRLRAGCNPYRRTRLTDWSADLQIGFVPRPAAAIPNGPQPIPKARWEAVAPAHGAYQSRSRTSTPASVPTSFLNCSRSLPRQWYGYTIFGWNSRTADAAWSTVIV